MAAVDDVAMPMAQDEVAAHSAHAPDVRLVDVAGTLSNAGLLQLRTSKGYGSICGMNAPAVNQACKEMGYTHGWIAQTKCSQYGGSDICGAVGTPVAMQNLNCGGHETSLQDCTWDTPDDTCKDHSKDSVIWCSHGEPYVDDSFKNGAVRLVGPFGAPSRDGTGRLEEFLGGKWNPVCGKGFPLGSASVACKQMGFSGVDPQGGRKCKDVGKDQSFCGEENPTVELSCTGKENEVTDCSHEYDPDGDDKNCAPNESVVVRCTGDGDTSGLVVKMPAPMVKVGAMLPLPGPPIQRRREIQRRRQGLEKFL